MSCLPEGELDKVLAIDIGSNTIKSLSGYLEDGKFYELESRSLPIRITKADGLVDDAAEKIAYAIEYLLHEEEGDFDFRVVATSALRTCPNREEICRQVDDMTGVEIDVISGQKEAFLSAVGAIYDKSIKVPSDFVFMDLGGGSLELAFCREKKVEKVDSFAIGAVRLTEMFIENPSEKIPAQALIDMSAYCKDKLKDFKVGSDKSLAVATGGAVAAAKYMLEHLGLKSFNESLLLSDLEYLLEKISKENVQERIKNYAIPENRADIIPASFVCLIACMQELNLNELLYAKQSLRRGICVEHFCLVDCDL
ncbi:MAG: hypothetical protein R3Y46_02925 [Opitutales bacterium]